MSLAPLFTDHAVLQRDKPVPVWGRAAPDERVMVAFRGQTVAASANRDGCWTAWLGPLSATPPGADLSVAGDKGGTAGPYDVVVGEVWLCSGQSNMEFVLNDPHNATFRVQDAEAEVNKARFPLIRQFKVARQLAAAPAETVGAPGCRARPRQRPCSRPWATSGAGDPSQARHARRHSLASSPGSGTVMRDG